MYIRTIAVLFGPFEWTFQWRSHFFFEMNINGKPVFSAPSLSSEESDAESESQSQTSQPDQISRDDTVVATVVNLPTPVPDIVIPEPNIANKLKRKRRSDIGPQPPVPNISVEEARKLIK